MAHENDDPFAVPPPVGLPTEEKVREKIEAVAGPRYRKQRQQLYARLGELSAGTRRWVLLAVVREYYQQRRAPSRQPQSRRRTGSERCAVCNRRIARSRGGRQRIEAAAYD